MGVVGTPRSVICPHGVLGKSKCKKCINLWAWHQRRKKYGGTLPPRKVVTLEERFWAKVNKTDTCWIWVAGRHPQDYGQFAIGGGRSKPAHVVSWELVNGPVPEGKILLHSCDNPPCVRPDHLSPGTQADNVADMDSKGRRCQGSRHPWAKITEADVIAMRASSESHNAIAKRYGLHQVTVAHIRKRMSWRHVA